MLNGGMNAIKTKSPNLGDFVLGKRAASFVIRYTDNGKILSIYTRLLIRMLPGNCIIGKKAYFKGYGQ
jgi:hypothetical protein